MRPKHILVATLPGLFIAALIGTLVAGSGCDSPASAASLGIPDLPADQWAWVPFPESRCRDGSSTGIGVNVEPGSNALVIFLEGGGACFNAQTCAGTPSHFGAEDFALLASASCGIVTGHKCISINDGIFDRTQSANPVRSWSFVYVPYCTGDVHMGDNAAGVVPGLVDGGAPALQQFVGYANLGRYLARLVPTFPAAAQVLLTGVSAGGFGSMANYQQVAQAFGGAVVDVLDDSGPFLEDPYLATCEQEGIEQLWRADRTVLQACGSDCGTPGSRLLDDSSHLARLYPRASFGLLSSVGDSTTSDFFGFGAQQCTGFQPLTTAQLTAGLLDWEAKVAPYPNAGAFLFPGTDHTSLQSTSFYTRVAADPAAPGSGAPLTSWVGALVGGSVRNVGP
jgi:hypothetical protein